MRFMSTLSSSLLLGGALGMLLSAAAIAAGTDEPARALDAPITAVDDNTQLTQALETNDDVAGESRNEVAQEAHEGANEEHSDVNEGHDDANDAKNDVQQAQQDANDAKNDAQDAQQDASEATQEGGSDHNERHTGDTGASNTG